MDIAKIIGNNLKEARKLKGLTQKELAAELHKYQSDYSEYENGKVQLDMKKLSFFVSVWTLPPTNYSILTKTKTEVCTSVFYYLDLPL